MAEQQSWSARVSGQLRRLSVAIDHDTDDYNRENADLPWYDRLLARNWLTLFYSVPPSALNVLLFRGLDAVVDAVSNATSSDPGVRMGVWFIVAVIALEVGTDIMKTDLDPAYIQRKPLYWVILAVVWSVSLVVSGGNLGMWAFGVWWLGWWVSVLVSNVVQYGESVLDSLWSATLFSTVFLVFAVAISGYIYVVSTVTGAAQVVLTGFVYPAISWGIKEVAFKVLSGRSDKSAGLSEDDDVEKGTFITYVVMVEAALELVNKVAIARIASTYGFVGTMALSFAIEVSGKAAVLWWHRSKVVAEEVVVERVEASGILPVAAASDESPNRTARRRVKSLKKAAHRHENANEKKRYEFRVYYEELGESVATMVAFGTLIAAGELQPAEGLARLAFALACEYFADLGVWVMMEWDGYNLTNVVYRSSPARIGTLVFLVLCGLAGVELGNEMVAMAVVNGTMNATMPNATMNVTL